MKAARLVGPRRFEFTDIPVPTATDGQVFIRTEYASICGSDLRYYDRTYAEEEYPLGPGDPCHEVVGIIEESFDRRYTKGQRVIALKNANLREYATVDGNDIVALPDWDIDPAISVLCQPIGTVIHALQEASPMWGKKVLIFGQGPIGLAFTELVARSGASQVIVCDRHDYRLNLAKRLGATHTINATREDAVEAVTEITKGELADVVVEAVGRPETANQVFQAIKVRGQAIIFGLAHDDNIFPFDWATMGIKVPRILVTNSNRSGDRSRCVRDAVDLVAQGRIDLTPYKTHELAWQDVGKAFEIYSHKLEESLKVVLKVS